MAIPWGRADRIAGCLLGSAIGDALGSAFEFVDSRTIARYLGEPVVRRFEPAMPGSLLHPRAAGRPTDDTAMAICVARAMASRAEPTPERFARSFLDGLERGSGLVAEMFWTGGPGGATTRALSRLRAGADPAGCGAATDGGNGAAMRAHPVGVLGDRLAVLRVAGLQARVTHGHPAAVAAAQAVAVVVHAALRGAGATADCPAGIDEPTFARAWATAHADLRTVDGDLPPHLRDVGMSGWETVSAAHAISLLYDDPIEAIGRAAASGGDTDTVAAIVGAIVGARCGKSAFPVALTAGLRDGGTIAEAVDALVDADGFPFVLDPRAGNLDDQIKSVNDAFEKWRREE